MYKRGLAEIIVTLIMIVLAIVGVGIVWAVVANTLSSGEDEIKSGFGQTFLDMKIEKVEVQDNGDVQVTVKREAGKADVTGVNIIVSDGRNSQVLRKDSINELATKTYTISQSELTEISFVKDVSIAPITTSGSKEKIGSPIDENELTNDQVYESSGLVLKNDFEANTNPFNGAVNGIVSLDSSQHYLGDKSLRHDSNATGTEVESYTSPSSGVSSVVDSNVSGKSYTLSVAVKSDSTPLTNQLQIFFFCMDSTYARITADNVNVQFTPTTSWDVYTLRRNPCSASAAYLGFRIDLNNQVGNSTWYDNLMIFDRNLTSTQLEALYDLEE